MIRPIRFFARSRAIRPIPAQALRDLKSIGFDESDFGRYTSRQLLAVWDKAGNAISVTGGLSCAESGNCYA